MSTIKIYTIKAEQAIARAEGMIEAHRADNHKRGLKAWTKALKRAKRDLKRAQKKEGN